MDPDLPVVHTDADVVAVDKPAHLLAVPGRGADKQDCASARLRRLYADAEIVHRLDMATSGLLLFARGTAMQRVLHAEFAARRVAKTYVAVVHGVLADDAGTIELPLAADWPRRPSQRVDLERGKPSTTHWRVIARDEARGATRVELQPLGGRTHQLRVHLTAIGHTIVGDTLYGAPETDAPRLLLHASALDFALPGGAAYRLRSAPPF